MSAMPPKTTGAGTRRPPVAAKGARVGSAAKQAGVQTLKAPKDSGAVNKSSSNIKTTNSSNKGGAGGKGDKMCPCGKHDIVDPWTENPFKLDLPNLLGKDYKKFKYADDWDNFANSFEMMTEKLLKESRDKVKAEESGKMEPRAKGVVGQAARTGKAAQTSTQQGKRSQQHSALPSRGVGGGSSGQPSQQSRQPSQPGKPSQPGRPSQQSRQPSQPGKPSQPGRPSQQSRQPSEPGKPSQPGRPSQQSRQPSEPGKPSQPGRPSQQSTKQVSSHPVT